MMSCSKDAEEREEGRRLASRLLPNEEEHWIERAGARVRWLRLRAQERENAVGTIVLIHGATSNASRWEEFVEKTPLKKDWDIIRVDLRCHAASVCRTRATLEAWCADIEAILNDAGVCDAVHVGHSLGAHVAMYFAAAYPQRVRALVLLDPLVTQALSDRARAMRRRRPLLVLLEGAVRLANRLGIRRRLQRQDLRAMDEAARVKIQKGGRELEAFIAEYSSVRSDLKYMHAADLLRDMIEVGRPSPAPEKLAAPALVIASTGGTYTDAAAMAQWVGRMPKGEIRAVHCAHWPLTECPLEVSRVIEEWLGGGKLSPDKAA